MPNIIRLDPANKTPETRIRRSHPGVSSDQWAAQREQWRTTERIKQTQIARYQMERFKRLQLGTSQFGGQPIFPRRACAGPDEIFMQWFGPRMRKAQKLRNEAYERSLAAMDGILEDSSEGGTNDDWERYDQERD